MPAMVDPVQKRFSETADAMGDLQDKRAAETAEHVARLLTLTGADVECALLPGERKQPSDVLGRLRGTAILLRGHRVRSFRETLTNGVGH